jgi:hypothetical protein
MIEPPPFWPLTAEGWSTLVSNVITIGTLVVGLPFAIRWAHRMRREASEIRRRLRAAAGEAFYERASLQHITLINPVDAKDDTRWNIQWSRPPGAQPSDLKTGVATITSKHLLHVLKNESTRIKASKSGTVVGTVEFADHGEGQVSGIVVPRVHYIYGDPKWREKLLEFRQSLARWLGDVI